MDVMTSLQRLWALLITPTARGMVIYILGNAAAAGVSFLLLPIFTRALTTEEFGLYALALGLVGFLLPLASLGLPNVVSRFFIDRDDIDYPRLVSTCLLMSFLAIVTIIIIVAVLNIIIPGQLYHWLGGLSGDLIPALFVMVAAQILMTICLSLLQMEGRPFGYSLVRIIYAIAFGGAGVFAVLYLSAGGKGLVLAKAAVDVILVVGILFWLGWRNYMVPRVSAGAARHALKYGLPLVPHTAAIGIIGITDRLLLTNMMGTSATGVYSVGFQIGMIMWLIVNSMNQAWLPWFYRQMKIGTHAVKVKVVQATYLLIAAIAGISLVFALLSPLIVSVMVGPTFQEASNICPWIVLGFFFHGLYALANSYLYYAGYTVRLATATGLTAIANIAFSWWLIELNGIVGAAQGTALAYLLAWAFVGFAARKAIPMPWLHIFSLSGRRGGLPK